ncbi:MAG: helix-turn-helix transcriptional regulator [Hydrogenophaga sp.]|jgi:molybdate transport repressor ModE-like protein|nr:helix-turn-helix transcriptional regulator [Hydrogenophaga sp.]
MPQITLQPVWTLQRDEQGSLSPRLIELLCLVQQQGSLVAACQAMGLSYRHGWDLVRGGETLFNTTLLHMERGKGSTLSPLAEKLVWADHRIRARLQPVLDSVASELRSEIERISSEAQDAFRIHASHGFSIEKLLEALMADGLPVARRYATSTAAAAALRDGQCDACGVHLPLGAQQGRMRAHLGQWLQADDLQVIDIATRRQGLMVGAGNPHKVYELADLARDGLRFINRPADSGTRFLLDGLLQDQGIASQHIRGYEQSEPSHAAVAACVASGLADVGFGLERPARYFQLDFMPMVTERYVLVCHRAALDHPVAQALLRLLADPAFRSSINALPGYDARSAGSISPWPDAFPEGSP